MINEANLADPGYQPENNEPVPEGDSKTGVVEIVFPNNPAGLQALAILNGFAGQSLGIPADCIRISPDGTNNTVVFIATKLSEVEKRAIRNKREELWPAR